MQPQNFPFNTTPQGIKSEEHPTPIGSLLPAQNLNNSYLGLTGSQIPKVKQPLPFGVYIIAGFSFISFAISFLDTSSASFIYTIGMLFNLIAAVGLLLRVEVARKASIWLCVLTIVICATGFIMLFSAQQQLKEARQKFDAAMSQITAIKTTPKQEEGINLLTTKLKEEEKRVGKTVNLAYAKLGITTAEAIVAVIYLTRPKIKQIFRA